MRGKSKGNLLEHHFHKITTPRALFSFNHSSLSGSIRMRSLWIAQFATAFIWLKTKLHALSLWNSFSIKLPVSIKELRVLSYNRTFIFAPFLSNCATIKWLIKLWIQFQLYCLNIENSFRQKKSYGCNFPETNSEIKFM